MLNLNFYSKCGAYCLSASIYLLISMILCYCLIHTGEVEIFEMISEYNFIVMLVFFSIGMIFFLADKRIFVFISLLACGILAYFLKSESKDALIKPDFSRDKLIIINIDGQKVTDSLSLVSTIKSINPDIIAINYANLPLFKSLKNHLSDIFPALLYVEYHSPLLLTNLQRLSESEVDFYDFNRCDAINNVFSHQYVKNDFKYSRSSLIFDDLNIEIINFDGQQSDRHNRDNVSHDFDYLSEVIKSLDAEKIIIGNFNTVYWAPKMRVFRKINRLDVSSEINIAGLSSPGYTHLLHSSNLQSVCFDALETSDGIIGNLTCIQIRKPRGISGLRLLRYE